jgi:hypothetical protein
LHRCHPLRNVLCPPHSPHHPSPALSLENGASRRTEPPTQESPIHRSPNKPFTLHTSHSPANPNGIASPSPRLA